MRVHLERDSSREHLGELAIRLLAAGESRVVPRKKGGHLDYLFDMQFGCCVLYSAMSNFIFKPCIYIYLGVFAHSMSS
jgi:hypothetical protein